MDEQSVRLHAMNEPDHSQTPETTQTPDRTGRHYQHGPDIGRRKFLAVGGAVATTLVAGCSGGDTRESTGTFRMYVSDQPVAIDEFDSLDVTIDGARLYRGDEDATDSVTTNETVTTDDDPAEQEEFVEIDVDDETVDLTTVTGEKASRIFDGEVPTDRYSSIHLSISQVAGVVDGDEVAVKLPSDRLKIITPFEVTEDEPLEFVFDITVVEKGQTGGYNLLPVIGESGVVGEDVEMQVVEQSQADGAGQTEATGV